MLLAFIRLLVAAWLMEPRCAFDSPEILQSLVYCHTPPLLFTMLICYKLQEGKLRVLQFDSAHGRNCFSEENVAVLV